MYPGCLHTFVDRLSSLFRRAAFCDFEHFEGEKGMYVEASEHRRQKKKEEVTKNVKTFFEKSKIAHLQNKKFGL